MAESREKKKTSRIPSIGKGQTPLYKHTLIILSSINKCLNGINVQYALRVHPLRNINHSRNAGSVMGHQVKTTIMIHSATLWISCVIWNLELKTSSVASNPRYHVLDTNSTKKLTVYACTGPRTQELRWHCQIGYQREWVDHKITYSWTKAGRFPNVSSSTWTILFLDKSLKWEKLF